MIEYVPSLHRHGELLLPHSSALLIYDVREERCWVTLPAVPLACGNLKDARVKMAALREGLLTGSARLKERVSE